jgi:dephospho-CoA kinase
VATQKKIAKSSVVPIIGLVGGIASGKSFVGQILVQLGCVRIDADRIGHELLDKPMICQLLKQKFGPEIIGQDGRVDRVRLGNLVFGPDDQALQRRAELESIMHPAIRTSAVQMVHRLRHSDPAPTAIVIDAPLLIEAGWEPMCDWVLFVDTSEETRRKRASQRGWSEEHWAAREKAQLSIDRKKQAATHVISGDSSPEILKQQLSQLLDTLRS